MSFYRSFTSKEDLTIKGIDKIMLNLKKNIQKMETINQYTVIKEFFETLKIYKDILPSIENSNISKVLTSNIAAKLQSNLPNDYMNKTSKYVPVFYFTAISSVIIMWLKEGAKETSDEMARLIISMVNKNVFGCKNNNETDEEFDDIDNN